MSDTQTIRVLHCNSGHDGWTADSPDLAGWDVTSSSFAESKTQAEQAVAELLSESAINGERTVRADVQITHHIACSRS